MDGGMAKIDARVAWVQTSKATRIGKTLADAGAAPQLVFDPATHLHPADCKQNISYMSDIGLDDRLGVSSVAFCSPFQLFSNSAVTAIRDEVLSETVMKHHSFSSNINPKQLRGYGSEKAPFTFAAWKHLETLKVISEAAGIDVVPVMDYEIGHVNISLPGQSTKAVVDWHVDSYPFVCVLMLSTRPHHAEGTIQGGLGGETVIKTGSGDMIKICSPAKGWAVVLQGRYITHKALQALGGHERITMVTSFRPKSALKRDDSVLNSVRAVSNLPELYYQFASYRMEIATERIALQLKEMGTAHKNGEKLRPAETRAWLRSMEDFFIHTRRQLVDEEQVTPGRVDP